MAADLQVAFVRDTSARDRGVTSTGVGPRCDVWGSRMGIERVGTSDVEAVRRVLGGDTAAYATLVARYRDRLARYAVHMLGNREDAEEALQDAFVRAYRSLERCDDPARFGAWLYGILVNRCRTTGARAARRARVLAQVGRFPAHRVGGTARAAWRWLTRPRMVRLSPLGGLAIAAAFAIVALARPDRYSRTAPAGEREFGFVVVAPRAATVSLVG